MDGKVATLSDRMREVDYILVLFLGKWRRKQQNLAFGASQKKMSLLAGQKKMHFPDQPCFAHPNTRSHFYKSVAQLRLSLVLCANFHKRYLQNWQLCKRFMGSLSCAQTILPSHSVGPCVRLPLRHYSSTTTYTKTNNSLYDFNLQNCWVSWM